MKMILKQDVDGLGLKGDIVKVKNGFGRNYLIPRGIAVLATKSAMNQYKELARQAEERRTRAANEAEATVQKIEATEIVVEARVGEENRIFGTVTSQQVSLKLAENGITIDRRDIHLDEEIRLIGVYSATVKVHQNVTAKVKVHVVPKEEAAEA